MESTQPDIVVVGAGPAGLVAAIEGARAGARVVILEALSEPGRKLLATGGGRCNLTNTLDAEAMAARFARHRRFVAAVLRGFPPETLRRWMADLGVESHAPDGFHVFPVTHQARTVHAALLSQCRRLGVEVVTGWPVARIRPQRPLLVVGPGGTQRRANRVIIATGGGGYPRLGNGLPMWELLAALGHRVEPPVPAMVPLLTREEWPARCRADTLPGVELTFTQGKGPRWTGDLIFHRTGITGPVVLDASGEVAARLSREETVTLRLRLRGGWTPDDWRVALESAQRAQAATTVGDWLSGQTAPSLALVALAAADLPPATALGRLPRRARHTLSEWLGGIHLTVTGTGGFAQAMVTRGGVSPRDVHPVTLESRHLPGLQLAGEVLDVDGPCGGFNLQWAFASGYRAGTSALQNP